MRVRDEVYGIALGVLPEGQQRLLHPLRGIGRERAAGREAGQRGVGGVLHAGGVHVRAGLAQPVGVLQLAKRAQRVQGRGGVVVLTPCGVVAEVLVGRVRKQPRGCVHGVHFCIEMAHRGAPFMAFVLDTVIVAHRVVRSKNPRPHWGGISFPLCCAAAHVV